MISLISFSVCCYQLSLGISSHALRSFGQMGPPGILISSMLFHIWCHSFSSFNCSEQGGLLFMYVLLQFTPNILIIPCS